MEPKATPFRDRPEFLRGRNGEHLVADRAKRKGWFVIPSYDYGGEDGNKAPKLEGLNRGIVVPDLDIARDGQRRWVEVKTKQAPTLTRVTNRMEHGINVRHWESYREVERITGCKVFLVIYEEESGDVLGASLDAIVKWHGGKLRETRMRKNGSDDGAMFYFARDSLKLLYNVDAPEPTP